MVAEGRRKVDRRRGRVSGVWRLDSTMERPGGTTSGGRTGARDNQTPSLSVHAAIPPVLDGIVASVA